MERDGIRFLSPCSPIALQSNVQTVSPPPGSITIKEGNSWELPSTDNKNTRVILYASGAREIIDLNTNQSTWTLPSGRINVQYVSNRGPQHAKTSIATPQPILQEEFDTVLFAVGRHANVVDLNLDRVAVTVVNGKVLVDENERTTANTLLNILSSIQATEHLSLR